MGFFKNIAKRRVANERKKKDAAFYKKRDAKLDAALSAGKVTKKQKKALGVGGTKKYRDKFKPKTGLAGRADRINQMNTDWKK